MQTFQDLMRHADNRSSMLTMSSGQGCGRDSLSSGRQAVKETRLNVYGKYMPSTNDNARNFFLTTYNFCLQPHCKKPDCLCHVTLYNVYIFKNLISVNVNLH